MIPLFGWWLLKLLELRMRLLRRIAIRHPPMPQTMLFMVGHKLVAMGTWMLIQWNSLMITGFEVTDLQDDGFRVISPSLAPHLAS